MVQCRSGFSGVDTINITSYSDVSKIYEPLLMHEDTTIIVRNDIHLLLQPKVTSKQISPKLENSFIENAKKRYFIEQLKIYTKGSTYVSFNDLILINLIESYDKQDIVIMNDIPNGGNRELHIKQSWPILINIYYKSKISMATIISFFLFLN